MSVTEAPPRISKDYAFLLPNALLVLFVTSIPYVLGAALGTRERIFGGFVYALEDCYSYLAKMRLGAEGRWLFRIAYTPEPHPGTLFFPFHILLGKLAALLPGADLTTRMVWVYHGARLLCGLLLLLVIYRFLAALTRPEERTLRRLAWLMTAWGGGLGWLLVALGRPDWLGSMPLDFILPEGFTFLVLYSFPHIALARSFLLLGFLRLFDDVGAQRRCAPTAGVLWLLMGLIVPFYVPVAWAVTGALLAMLWLRERRFPRSRCGAAFVAAIISAPIVAYSLWVFSTQPVYRSWSAQNLILSPHPLHYLAAYGVPLALACFAVREAWRREGLAWTAPVWVGVVPLLLYLPFNLQRRLVEGAQIPLMLLAAMGTLKIARRLNLRLLIPVVLTLLASTNLMLVTGSALGLSGRPFPIYRDADEVALLDWLGSQAGFDDVVLASYDTGNYLPARTVARAFVGHGPESINCAEKKQLVARFFDATTDDNWRLQLLETYSVDYVFWGPHERALGDFDPYRVPYLRPVSQAGGYSLFEVQR